MFKRLTLTLILLATLFTALPVRADSAIPPVQRLGTGIPTSIAASLDGKTLAVGSSIGVWLLDANTLQPFSFWDTGFWVNSVSYSTDGKYVKANETVLDAASGGKVDVKAGQVIWVNHRCTFDGRLCAQDFKDTDTLYSTQVIDTNTTVSKKILEWSIKDVAWSPTDKILYDVVGGRISSWQTSDWQLTQTLDSFFTGELKSIRWSIDGTEISSLNSVWSVNTAQSLRTKECWSFYACKTWQLSYSASSLYVYDQPNNEPRRFIPHRIILTAATTNGAFQELITSGVNSIDKCSVGGACTYERSTRIWSSRTFSQEAEIPVLFYDLAFSPNGNLVAGHTQSDVEVWDWKTQTKLWSADENIGRLCPLSGYASLYSCWERQSGLSIDRSNKYLATFAPSVGNVVRLYRLSTGELVTTLAGHTAPITAVAFSPDGTKVAASSLDGTILIWNVP